MPTEMSADAYNAMMAKQKVGKYGNKRIVIDGVSYDSEAEYNRWWQLVQLEREGTISELRRQVRIPLRFEDTTLGHYVADFHYLLNGQDVIEDVKSPLSRTPIYEWKKRHVLAQYGIEITEVDS